MVESLSSCCSALSVQSCALRLVSHFQRFRHNAVKGRALIMRGIHRAVRKHGVQEGSWFVVVSTPACTGHIKSTTVTGVEERFPLWLTSLTFTPMFFFHNEEAAIASFYADRRCYTTG